MSSFSESLESLSRSKLHFTCEVELSVVKYPPGAASRGPPRAFPCFRLLMIEF
jgi:hypothetical protein